jgi:hypothetical protein
VKLFHQSNPFVWRPSHGRHTCPCGSPPAGATDPADVAPSPLSWCAHPTWQHVWRPSQRRHTCTCNPPKHTVRQFLWDLAVLRGSMCGADATGATLACVAPMPRAPHIHLSVAPAPAPSPTLSFFFLFLSASPPQPPPPPASPSAPPPNRPRNRQIYPAKSFLLHSSRYSPSIPSDSSTIVGGFGRFGYEP